MLKYALLSGHIATASGLIPIIIAILNYKILNKPLKIIFYFLILSLANNLIDAALAYSHRTNVFVLHIYAIFEFAFVSYFYYTQLNGFIKKAIPYLISAFSIFCIINFIFIQKEHDQFNTYTRSVEIIIIMIYAAMFMLKQANADHDFRFGELSVNWINIALLIFYSCAFSTLAFANYLLTKSFFVNAVVWITYAGILVTENILFAVAFYKCKKQPTISL